MKNSNLRNILILVAAVLLVVYFRWQENNSSTPQQQDFILALSWQPAFCETKPNVRECRSQRANRFDAKHFSLHGLWPQPRDNVYCGVSQDIVRTDKSGRWRNLPKLEISENLRKQLETQMPGYRSYLHRHEWYKHGTCIEDGTPEQYFNISLQLMGAMNDSSLTKLFVNNIGREIQSAQIQKAFETKFGKGLGNRISVSCKRDGSRTLINELKISLATDGERKESLSEIFEAAPTLDTGCRRGIVDPTGLQ